MAVGAATQSSIAAQSSEWSTSSQLSSNISTRLKKSMGISELSSFPQSSRLPDMYLNSQPAHREESPSGGGNNVLRVSTCYLFYVTMSLSLHQLTLSFGKLITFKFKLRYRHELELHSQIMAVSCAWS